MSSFVAAGADVAGEDSLVLVAGRGGDLGGVVSVAGGLGGNYEPSLFAAVRSRRSPAHQVQDRRSPATPDASQKAPQDGPSTPRLPRVSSHSCAAGLTELPRRPRARHPRPPRPGVW